MIIVVCSLKCMCTPCFVSIGNCVSESSFIVCHLLLSEIAKCIAWGRLLLFYNNYIVYYMYNVHCFVLIGCCVSELQAHLCPYRKVWPEAVKLFYKNYRIVYMFV